MAVESQRIIRYRRRSLHLLQSASDQMRGRRWSRSEDLLWASLTLAVKGVALSRGDDIAGDEEVREYAQRLGQESRDRRIRAAFDQVGSFGETLDRVRESRSRVDHLYIRMEDVKSAVERLWSMVPNAATVESQAESLAESRENEWVNPCLISYDAAQPRRGGLGPCVRRI